MEPTKIPRPPISWKSKWIQWKDAKQLKSRGEGRGSYKSPEVIKNFPLTLSLNFKNKKGESINGIVRSTEKRKLQQVQDISVDIKEVNDEKEGQNAKYSDWEVIFLPASKSGIYEQQMKPKS